MRRYNRKMNNRTKNTKPMIFSPVMEIYMIDLNIAHVSTTRANIRLQFFAVLKPYGMSVRERIVRSRSIHVMRERVETESIVVRLILPDIIAFPRM